MDEASGIYEPMLPVGWIGGRPHDHELTRSLGADLPAHWCEVAVQRALDCGIEVTAERRGFVIYNFANWLPGVARPPGTGRIRTFGESSETAKPALVQRLRVINSQVTLLHAAAALMDEVSLPVARVNRRDLYSFDYPHESAEGNWYRRLGDPLPTQVTSADRDRLEAIPATTFELSLAWLDDVVSADALIEFDLLNQAQTALGTHDYPSAVVAGWTICELLARALGSGVSGGEVWNIGRVFEALELHGFVSPPLADDLRKLRHARNDWLHKGLDPNEAAAADAVRLPGELLRAVVPDLVMRPARALVHL